MQSPGLTRDEEQAAAEREFDGLVAALEDSGIRVIVINDTPDPETPDAIFPNNWISTHADGTVVMYPMQVENRRPERRQDIVDTLAAEHGFRVADVIDLSAHEAAEQYLEGTGSLVLDRPNGIAYACLSPRTSLEVLADFAQRLDYEVVAFEAADAEGVAIYHTNVMMNVGEDFAVLCLESIVQPEQRSAVQALTRKYWPRDYRDHSGADAVDGRQHAGSSLGGRRAAPCDVGAGARHPDRRAAKEA